MINLFLLSDVETPVEHCKVSSSPEISGMIIQVPLLMFLNKSVSILITVTACFFLIATIVRHFRFALIIVSSSRQCAGCNGEGYSRTRY